MADKEMMSMPGKMVGALEIPDSAMPDHDLLVLNATQGALGLRMRAAEIVGMAERSRATAYTIGAALTNIANFFPFPRGNITFPRSNIDFALSFLSDASSSLGHGRPLEAAAQLIFGPPVLTALDMIEHPISGIIRTAVGIGSVALTGLAVAHWLNVGNVMRRVLEYEPKQKPVAKS